MTQTALPTSCPRREAAALSALLYLAYALVAVGSWILTGKDPLTAIVEGWQYLWLTIANVALFLYSLPSYLA